RGHARRAGSRAGGSGHGARHAACHRHAACPSQCAARRAGSAARRNRVPGRAGQGVRDAGCSHRRRPPSRGTATMNRRGRLWLLPLSVLAALLLGLLPLPAPVQGLRPYWLALVVAYWVIEEPDHAGLGFAFLVGLVADLVSGSLLGEHALRLVVMAFILQRFRAQLRFFPLAQQALAMGGLLLNDRVVAAAIHLLLGLPQLPW